MSHQTCCVVNCKNTSRNSTYKFYKFPVGAWKLEQRKKWIAALRRKNPDGSPWYPKLDSTICSAHFVGGKKCDAEASPSYVPSIFPPKLSQASKLIRFVNLVNPDQKDQNKEVETESAVHENIHNMIVDKECQAGISNHLLKQTNNKSNSDAETVLTKEVKVETSDDEVDNTEDSLQECEVKIEQPDHANGELIQTDPLSLEVKTESRDAEVETTQVKKDLISEVVKTESRDGEEETIQVQPDPITYELKTESPDDEEETIQVQPDPITFEVTDPVTSEVTDKLTSEVTDSITSELTYKSTSEVTDTKTSEVTDSITSELTYKSTSEVTDTKTSEVTDTKTSEVTDTKTSAVTDTKTSALTDPKTSDVTDTKTSEVTDTKTSAVTDTKTSALTDPKTSEVTDTKTSEVTDTKTSEVTNPITSEVETKLRVDEEETLVSEKGKSVFKTKAKMQKQLQINSLPPNRWITGRKRVAQSVLMAPERTPPRKRKVRIRCINCGVNVLRMQRHSLLTETEEVQQRIRHQNPDLTDIPSDSVICHACWLLLHQSIETPESPTATKGHTNVCVDCGRSLCKTRFHKLSNNTEREEGIRDLEAEKISPRSLRTSDRICHSCWMKRKRTLGEKYSEPSTSVVPASEQLSVVPGTFSERIGPVEEEYTEKEATIVLSNYGRARYTQAHCFFPGCRHLERYSVPISLRKRLFTDFKFYVPANCRICNYHLKNDLWHKLNEFEISHTFTEAHIYDFVSLLQHKS